MYPFAGGYYFKGCSTWKSSTWPDVLQDELDDLGLREAMLFAQPIRDAGERPIRKLGRGVGVDVVWKVAGFSA